MNLRKKVALVCAAGSALVLAPSAWTWGSTVSHRTSLDDVPVTDVALVLGAGIHPDGTPTRFLAGRLDVALALYRDGKVKAILVSGDNGHADYDEPESMRDYLVAHGVPTAKIALDYAGFDTWDSCVRAKKIFGVDRLTVVTQNFHLPRAVALCRRAGIDAWGVGHDSRPIDGIATTISYLREVPATLKASGDILFATDPHFLGPREDGIDKALK
ncbi:SanA/YdcF family protein [Actinocorallia lasiicapitis]